MAGPQSGEHPATGALPTQPATTQPATIEPATIEPPPGAADAPVTDRPADTGRRLPDSTAESTAATTAVQPTETAAVQPAGTPATQPTQIPATQPTETTATQSTEPASEPAVTTAQADEPTGTIAPRWTGSAAIPPPTPRRRWWHRLVPAAGTPAPTAAPGAATEPVLVTRPARSGPPAPLDPTRAEITRRQPEPLNRTAVMPDPAEVGAALAFRPEPDEPYRERSYQDWENTPPVDPWADHDTLWQAAPGAPVAPPAQVGPPAGPFPPAVFGRGTLPPTLVGPATTAAGRAAAPPHRPPTNPPAPTISAPGWDGPGGADTHTRDADGQGTAAQVAPDPAAGAPSWRRRLFTRPSSRTARPAAGIPGTGPGQAGAAPGRAAQDGAADTPAGGPAAVRSRASWATPATQGPVPPWWNPANAGTQPPDAPGTPAPSSWARRVRPLAQGGSALRLPPTAPVPPAGWAPPGLAAQGRPPATVTAPARPPAPLKGKPGKAPKESRADRKRRLRTGDLPPPWSPPTPGPPPRRRRRRRLRLFVLLLIAVLVAAYWSGWASMLGLPYAGQYPVSPSLPERVADLHLRDDAGSNRTAERLTRSLYDAGVAADEVFAGVYGDDNGKRVALFGTTGFRLSPRNDVDDEIQRLAAEYDVTNIASFDLGEVGAHERCGVGRSDGTSVVVCSWADHGSLASAVLTRRSLSDSADVVGLLREAVLGRS